MMSAGFAVIALSGCSSSSGSSAGSTNTSGSTANSSRSKNQLRRKTMDLQQKTRITYEFSGQPDARSGWTFLPSEEGKPVYVPFEGTYESKGGRIRSPRFSLNKPSGKAAFYHLTFTARAAVQGYWWVDFYDKDGKMLPDINSGLNASEKEIQQDGVFLADPRSVTAEISFVMKQGVSVRDIRLEPFTPAEAADWCDKLYAGLPQKPFQVSKDAFALLPKTKAALNNGTPWRILLLGDSLVNDTWCSNFQALVMRDFPNAKPDFMISVRGSTGAAYYCIPEHFREYVGRFKPDLVMIGGISNYHLARGQGPDDRVKNLVSLIGQCRAVGAEVVLMSPPLSWKWRPGKEPAAWSENWITSKGNKVYDRSYQREAVKQTGIAYWDMTTVPCQIVADCPQPSSWFSRDVVHSNDRGKQLIGQNLAAWFRMAKE